MHRRNFSRTYSWSIFLLLIGLTWGQNKAYFEWNPVKSSGQSPLHPYSDGATTTSYDSRYFDISEPYHGTTGYFPDSSMPYINDGLHDDSYSSDFPKSQYYQYPNRDSGSYENYGYIRDETFNITKEKYGGFGGTGDTRGYGAYDYPKKTVHETVPQDLHQDSKIGTEFPDLLRIGRSKIFNRRQPLPIHPLPPPL